MHLSHLAILHHRLLTGSSRPCTQRGCVPAGASWSRARPVPVLACKDTLRSQLSQLARASSIAPRLSITSFSRRLRFEINLLCDPGDQIALHFNPRFSNSRIVCNSFLANHWGKEEVNNTFPFEAKEPFQVTLCHPTGLLRWDRSDPANIGVLLMDLALPFLLAPYPVTSPLQLCLLLVFLLYPDLHPTLAQTYRGPAIIPGCSVCFQFRLCIITSFCCHEVKNSVIPSFCPKWE